MKFVVCITGKIGTGKSTVSSFFEKKGFEYLNMDEIGHHVFSQLKETIKKEFGTLERKEISNIVFNDPEKLKKLEEILHPKMLQILNIKTKEEKLYIVEAAIKRRLKIQCDLTITVIAKKEVIIERLKRKGLTVSTIEKILSAQRDILPEGLIIDNSSSLEKLTEKLECIYHFIKKSMNF
ncbi:dephospho-CoA kinase [Thermosipho ferrireducens]|uniref:Dephospho-CoA kinase n=1 Tax=Thermosipho ferrireducens TaxID=2571116 RepID=A0ABX7S4M4_9BACT|nr:dephospho-CoA kinase [Thermosipho ferrireducens]QTA37421.1 dephospho-CoA kinase [Thermosipho ferrireducens]